MHKVEVVPMMHKVAVVGGWRARFELLLLVRPTNRYGRRRGCCTLATAIPAKSERGGKKEMEMCVGSHLWQLHFASGFVQIQPTL